MTFAGAERTEQQNIGTPVEPEIAGGQRHHLRFGEHRHRLELKGGERFAGGQPGVGRMALDPPAATIGDLVFGKRGEEAFSAWSLVT
jgi:hypothetical protein